jgi:hypothetical protein
MFYVTINTTAGKWRNGSGATVEEKERYHTFK